MKEHPWAGQTVAYGLYDPLTTQRYIANSKTGVLTINAHGFIGNGGTDPILTAFPEKPAGVVRIFMLGGSSMAGNALRSDNSQTIAAYLERELNRNAAGGVRYQALNYGVSGGWSFSELNRFFAEIVHFDPDMVITLDGWNDGVRVKFEADRNHVDQALLNWDQLNYLYFEHFNGIERRRKRPPPLFTYSYLALVSSGWLGAVDEAARRALYAGHHMTALSRYLSEKNDGLHFALTRNLDAISAYSAANGFRHLAYLQPYAERKRPAIAEEQAALDTHHAIAAAQNGDLWRRETYQRLMAETYDRFERMFEIYGTKYADDDFIAFYDITNLFAETEETVYLDSIHYNERGNEIIAQRMGENVRSILARRQQ